MKTEFKIGDKIVVVSGHTRKIGKFYNIGDIGMYVEWKDAYLICQLKLDQEQKGYKNGRT